ncbi:hypothetical protein [Stieleria magnilauensis]|uniref:Uncharacterized protein n=1 Tax=Stieleria magnilauensis TaxID=2527963 RepID=A0ABX5XS67_9BACT|nr:hypothetical protein TBK1r_34310 [Planctomycetes bacterium TBK1r]
MIKEASVELRGSLPDELADATTKLLTFHGTDQQDDRDLRKPRRKDGLGKAYSFMVGDRIGVEALAKVGQAA